MKSRPTVALKLIPHLILIKIALGISSCPQDLGGGVCPDNSKCCKIHSATGQTTSGCLPHNNHLKGPGTCCHDTAFFGGGTACPGNYQCGYSVKSGTNSTICFLPDSQGNVIEEMPRYNIAEAVPREIGDYYGFPISSSDEKAVLAYYSNMGPILTSKQTLDSKIEVAVIVTHGSGRNADEYLYSMMTAAKMQSCYKNVLVIAPRFLAVEDGVFAVPVITDDDMIMISPMKWNETYPIPHTWRYGANALSPSNEFSSYDAMDAIVEQLISNSGKDGRFQNLKRVVVAGHSAGGQFTHRWSLTSNSPIWGDSIIDRNDEVKDLRMLKHGQGGVEIVVVVANPRSFAYLDGRRFMNSSHYQTPPEELRNSCPTYNSWEWGLDAGGLDAPYKDKALAFFEGDIFKLAARYSKRNVVYLAGGNDTEPLHGSCEDDWFQGATRLIRSQRFLESMERIFGKRVHSRLVVKNVGHDHGLIFQSEEARSVMFGNTENGSSNTSL